MNCAILFREGHSGHFLRALLLNMPAESAAFRMLDHWESLQGGVFLTHNPSLINLHKFDQVFRILPTEHVYHAIYNMFMKKMLVEEFFDFDLKNWINDPVFWYDKCFYHISESYQLIHQDIKTNAFENVVDFDCLTDVDYLSQWLKKNFDQTMTLNQKELVESYKSLQLQISLRDDDAADMETIVSPLTDNLLQNNPWFWAYAVFKYEKNNSLAESQRCWSVNQIDRPQLTADLLNLKYT